MTKVKILLWKIETKKLNVNIIQIYDINQESKQIKIKQSDKLICKIIFIINADDDNNYSYEESICLILTWVCFFLNLGDFLLINWVFKSFDQNRSDQKWIFLKRKKTDWEKKSSLIFRYKKIIFQTRF